MSDKRSLMYYALPNKKIKGFFCTKENENKTANEEFWNLNSSEMKIKLKTALIWNHSLCV